MNYRTCEEKRRDFPHAPVEKGDICRVCKLPLVDGVVEKNDDVKIFHDERGWHCHAQTHNWAGDFFVAHAPTREKVIAKMRGYIERDGDDTWLLKNPLLAI